MKIKKEELFLLSTTAIYQLIQYYLWVFRWEKADSLTYFYSADSFKNIYNSSAYEISSFLFQPWFKIFGYSILILMIAAFFYRLFIYKLIDRIYKPINEIILISLLFFPLHGLLSFFPGRDLFSTLFLYLSVSFGLKNKYIFALLFAFFAAKFRILAALPLLLALSFEIFSIIRIKGSKILKLFLASLFVFSLIYFIFNNLYILGYGANTNLILSRIQTEISSDYFNLRGYTDFPRMVLNLYYPLLSSRFFSPYSLLSIEAIFATFLILFGFIKGRIYAIPRFIIFASSINLLFTLIMCALYPNITDMARKIYPLFFYASIIYFYINREKNSI